MRNRRSATLAGLVALMLGAVLALAACSERDTLQGKLGYEDLYTATEKENMNLEAVREQERKLESKGEPAALPAEPLVPSYNPLEQNPISITMRDESLHDVLFIIARNAGLNLVIEPGISLEENRVTISFESASSADVLESLLDAYDLTWSVRNNVLYVKRFEERTFDLGFLNTKSTMDIATGGDIFGSVDADGGAGDLSGTVNVSSSLGKGVEEGSIYALVSENVRNILFGRSISTEGGSSVDDQGQYGFYTIDPMAGSLHVRTTPSKVKAVATMLRGLQKKLKRQVVIDARIMEVELSDAFRFGIDWNFVANRLINGITYGGGIGWNGSADSPVISIPNAFSTKTNLPSPYDEDAWVDGVATNVNTTLGQPVPPSTMLMSSTIDALSTFGGVKVISNPHVRARHGQPTLFTSGNSIRYVDQIQREIDEDTGYISYSVSTATVFDGIMLGVLPYVNENGTVDIQIFPIKSAVDQASLALVDVTGAGDRLTLPEVNIKNVSTSVRVRDGDTIILGGLIDKTHNRTDRELPKAGEIPLIGWLFKNTQRSEITREMVIIMDIRIVG